MELFKKDGHDIIIVDTSGRHKQDAALFEEMEQVAAVVVCVEWKMNYIALFVTYTASRITETRSNYFRDGRFNWSGCLRSG